MRFLILGAGGVGGYFGGRLMESGADVTFLVRPGRREQLERDGLRVVSPLGDLRLPAQTVLAQELKPEYEVILLACKAYDLESAVLAVAPAVRGTCSVLPLLNGLGHLNQLDLHFGNRNVLGGTCSLNVTLRSDGSIQHVGTLQRIVFGERDPSATDRAEAIAEAFAQTKVDWSHSSEIAQDLWEKIVVLSALAAVTCLFRANIGEIMSAPGGREVAERILRTNIEISAREGYPPRKAAVEFARSMLTDPSSVLTTSMLRDIERGASVEADHIVGWMLERARAHALDDTVLSLAYTHLKAFESRREARRLPITLATGGPWQ